MVLTIGDKVLAITDQGFLCDTSQWDEAVAEHLAGLEGIAMTPAHWEIIWFVRDYYARFKHLPNARAFSKAIRTQLGEEKGQSRYLQRLFPDGPLKFACKIAGLPKPPTCL